MIRGIFLGIGFLAMWVMAPGCSLPPYVSGYSYYPQPATVEVLRRDGNQQSPLIVLASILGVHNEDQQQAIPYSVVVRMRFENVAQSNVTFDPASLGLVTGTLRAFGRPRVTPPGPMTLAPRANRELTAYFLFPPGVDVSQMNMRNLRLRWEVAIDSTPVVQTAVFQRIEPDEDRDYDVGY